MSHFTVLVVGENVDEQLHPFWELDLNEDEIKMDSRAQFFIEIKKDELEKKFEEFLKEEKEYIEKNSIIYETAEEWVKDWYGYILNLEAGGWGYYKNPQQKWDWYSVGGRWSGWFVLKDGAKGILGRPGIFGREEKNETPNRADQAKKGDIDWEAMVKDRVEEAKQTWNEIVVENKKNMTPEIISFIYGINSEDTLESYIKRREKFPTTFAVLKDGKWYEKGEMGWWGITTNEMPQDQWDEEFKKLIEDLPDDTLLTVVDCHI